MAALGPLGSGERVRLERVQAAGSRCDCARSNRWRRRRGCGRRARSSAYRASRPPAARRSRSGRSAAAFGAALPSTRARAPAAASAATAATAQASFSRFLRRATTGAGSPACEPPSAIHSSWSFASCAVWKRSSGSLARHVLTTRFERRRRHRREPRDRRRVVAQDRADQRRLALARRTPSGPSPSRRAREPKAKMSERPRPRRPRAARATCTGTCRGSCRAPSAARSPAPRWP